MEYLQNVCDKKGPSVSLPDSSVIYATQQGNLSLPSSLSADVSNAVVLPSLENLINSLIRTIM